jgi:hypothetical protein
VNDPEYHCGKVLKASISTRNSQVKEQAFYMKHAMVSLPKVDRLEAAGCTYVCMSLSFIPPCLQQDNDDLKAVLTHASDMLRELRTGLLTPKNYYELYMKVSSRRHPATYLVVM